MDRFSKMMGRVDSARLSKKGGNRMSVAKTNKGQAEQGCSLVGSDPVVTARVGTHTNAAST